MTIDIATALAKRLNRLSAGSCTCGAKSPDIQWHDAACRYRLAEEIRENVDVLEEQRIEHWRRRRDAEGSRDVSKAACASMRIERDEAIAARETAERERDEAREALKPFRELIIAIDRNNVVIGRAGNNDPEVSDAEVARLVLPDKQVMVSEGVMAFGRTGPRPVSKAVTAADFRRAREAGGGDG